MKLLLFLLPAVVYTDFIEDLVNLPTSDPPSCYKEIYKMVSCIEPHKEIIKITLSTLQNDENEIYNIGLANKALQIGRNISECLGRDHICEIPKLVLYSLHSADYIGRRLYGDAFHCFVNAKTLEKISHCHRTSTPDNEQFAALLTDDKLYKNRTKTIFDCVAHQMYEEPSCTINRIVDLYHAGVASTDVFMNFLRFWKKYPVEWNFDAGKHCDN
ncbi:unnamed protein product [Caenorhabditis brenneri]